MNTLIKHVLLYISIYLLYEIFPCARSAAYSEKVKDLPYPEQLPTLMGRDLFSYNDDA